MRTSKQTSGFVYQDNNELPLPPIVQVNGRMFPTFPEMIETAKEVGNIFTYLIEGRRMTIIADKAAYRHVFFAKDSEDVELDSAKLAHHWFGIDKQLARDYTRPGLDATRKAMNYKKMLKANEDVGKHVKKYFNSLDNKGTGDLWDIAMLTFVPVVQHLFGKETFDESICPAAAETLWAYDEDFKKVANGVPRKYFPEMEARGQELSSFFERSIAARLHEQENASNNCPVLKARLSVIPKNMYTPEQRARFVFSVFWASQGNTIPGTFWMLGLIATNEKVKERLVKELRTTTIENYDFSNCEYLRACVKETLRLKVANITLRSVLIEIILTDSSGNKYRVPKGDEITVASYLQHRDEKVYKKPNEFIPERWLKENGGEEISDFEWFPFGAGTNKCSGRHLAQLELATIAGMFFKDFDIKPIDKLPEEVWENCVAMVGPDRRSFKFKFEKVPNQNSNL